MLRRLLPAFGAIALLPVTPVAAQQAGAADGAADAVMLSAMRGMFPTEPLTAEQEARLPAAQPLADKVVPDGVYARVMDDMLRAMMGPMADLFSSTGMSAETLSLRLGMTAEHLGKLSEAERLEVTALLDPAYDQRGRVAMNAMIDPLRDIIVAVEPGLRSGIARAYAARFDAAELAAIGAFFDTPVGARFAGELLPLFSDPQVMSASMEMLPQVMERMPQMTEAMVAAMTDLPPERGFADLNNRQRARLAQLLGVDMAALKNGMVPPPVIVPVP
ncbi:hypothetical protein PK98_11365 [Croceibacterium mercuriale]|uniref:DUF2059 domain-containing protein n=1 Tax=Croceibacterium mercuriale TaxID=1572751 RepID=A0A0B2BY12_9SPHN|nr:DUF2059 domain-containing protein [Croceibacterium mercuriale]KHL24576.1 hypothetical protein PK98_11365 [Croceibacterium mercuriale]